MWNKKIIIYLLITYIITEGCWLTVIALLNHEPLVPGSPLFVLYVVGGFAGPVISAFITKKFLYDKTEFKEFLKQIIRIKANAGWYIWPGGRFCRLNHRIR